MAEEDFLSILCFEQVHTGQILSIVQIISKISRADLLQFLGYVIHNDLQE